MDLEELIGETYYDVLGVSPDAEDEEIAEVSWVKEEHGEGNEKRGRKCVGVTALAL